MRKTIPRTSFSAARRAFFLLYAGLSLADFPIFAATEREIKALPASHPLLTPNTRSCPYGLLESADSPALIQEIPEEISPIVPIIDIPEDLFSRKTLLEHAAVLPRAAAALPVHIISRISGGRKNRTEPGGVRLELIEGLLIAQSHWPEIEPYLPGEGSRVFDGGAGRNNPLGIDISLGGDSLSTTFYRRASLPDSAIAARGLLGNKGELDWFGHLSRHLQGMDSGLSLTFRNRATPGASVNPAPGAPIDPRYLAFGTKHLPDQLGRILRARRLPDILLLAFGSNDLNWVKRWVIAHPREGLPDPGRIPEEKLETFLEGIVRNTVDSYRRHLGRLLRRALREQAHMLIAVYGVPDFESFDVARSLMEETPERYPFMVREIRAYPYAPPFRPITIRLSRMLNARLELMVLEIQRRLIQADPAGRIRLRHSDALARLDISDPAMYSLDAEHPSDLGRRRMARAILEDFPNLFILPDPQQSDRDGP